MTNFVKNAATTALCVFLFFSCSDDENDNILRRDGVQNFVKTTFPIKVTAEVDGHSQLKIKGNQIWWHHIQWDAPGLWSGDHPTTINGQAWYPIWPSNNSNALKNCICDSDAIEALETPIPATSTTISIKVTAARNPVVILEQPNSANDYTAVIEFNDYDIGADWYELTINMQ